MTIEGKNLRMGPEGCGFHIPDIQRFKVLHTRQRDVSLSILKGGGANVYESTIQSCPLGFVDCDGIGKLERDLLSFYALYLRALP